MEERNFFIGGLEISDGYASLPSGPELGIRLNEKVAAAHPYDEVLQRRRGGGHQRSGLGLHYDPRLATSGPVSKSPTTKRHAPTLLHRERDGPGFPRRIERACVRCHL